MNESEFWASGVLDEATGCIVWQRTKTRGYGNVRFDGYMQGAHRISYKLKIGPIPEGFELDHLCRNRACINVLHLEPVTRKINQLRGEAPPARNARKTHCPQGHPYDEENTYRVPLTGHRQCRICNKRRGRAQTIARRRS